MLTNNDALLSVMEDINTIKSRSCEMQKENNMKKPNLSLVSHSTPYSKSKSLFFFPFQLHLDSERNQNMFDIYKIICKSIHKRSHSTVIKMKMKQKENYYHSNKDYLIYL